MSASRGIWALAVLALGVSALLAWQTRPVVPAREASLVNAFDRLGTAPIPVLVIRPQQPRDVAVEVSQDGYRYEILRPGSPSLTVEGRRANGEASLSGEVISAEGRTARRVAGERFEWMEGGAMYSAAFAPDEDPAGVLGRVQPLQSARQDAFGHHWDTALLYWLYLPLGTAFAIVSFGVVAQTRPDPDLA